jgi:hypothetical protein
MFFLRLEFLPNSISIQFSLAKKNKKLSLLFRNRLFPPSPLFGCYYTSKMSLQDLVKTVGTDTHNSVDCASVEMIQTGETQGAGETRNVWRHWLEPRIGAKIQEDDDVPTGPHPPPEEGPPLSSFFFALVTFGPVKVDNSEVKFLHGPHRKNKRRASNGPELGSCAT